MGRIAKEHQLDLVPEQVNTDGLLQSMNQSAQHQSEIMDQFGDGQPYDRGRVVNEARFYMAQSAEAMLEAGKRLIVLKENEPHGEFESLVREQLGIPERTAQKMMKAAMKYLSPQLQSKAPTLALLGKSKLFELISEDDEDLAELAEGGTVAGLTLDDVDCMTARELRKALRDARENAEARGKVLADKNAKIDKLDEQLTRLKTYQNGPLIEILPPDEVAARLSAELTQHAHEALGIVNSKVLPVLRALDSHDHTYGTRHNIMAAGLIAQVEARLHELRGEFDLPRHLDGDSTPDWLREDADERVQASIDQATGGHA